MKKPTMDRILLYKLITMGVLVGLISFAWFWLWRKAWKDRRQGK